MHCLLQTPLSTYFSPIDLHDDSHTLVVADLTKSYLKQSYMQ